MKAVRTDVGIGGGFSAGTGVGKTCEIAATDQPEVGPDGVRLIGIRYTEPISISGRRGVTDAHKVRIRLAGMSLGPGGGGVDLHLPGQRAATVGSPFVTYARDGEGTGQVDLRNVLGSGVEVIGRVINVDVGEVVRWLDGVVSRAISSEVVCGGDWW